jgi:integrase
MGGRRRYFYGPTRSGVQDKLRIALRAVDDGFPVSSDRAKVGVFLTRWLTEVARPSVRPSTFVRYQQLAGHAVRGVGHLPLAKLSPLDLQKLYAQLGQRLAPRTVGHCHRLLHKALADAVRFGLVHRNVCDGVRPPRVARKEMRVLDADQARALLDAAAGDPLEEALYTLALHAGLRLGELLALKWTDFDSDARRLTINRTVRHMAGGGAVEGEPKSARSRRNVLLTPQALAALGRHRIRQTEQRLRATRWDDRSLIFTNGVGRHIQANNLLRRSFRPLLARAGLPAIRFHDLRHSCATLLLLAGVHVKVVSEILGHSNIGITLDTFSHVLPSMQAEAAAKMEALFTVAV